MIQFGAVLIAPDVTADRGDRFAPLVLDHQQKGHVLLRQISQVDGDLAKRPWVESACAARISKTWLIESKPCSMAKRPNRDPAFQVPLDGGHKLGVR